MKNGKSILLMICALSLALALGIFLGRNMNPGIALPHNNNAQPLMANEQEKDYRLDINAATQVQLMELPGIGEMMAQRIIAYRTENGPFSSTDDLLLVEGIGEKKLLQIEELIKVGG